MLKSQKVGSVALLRGSGWSSASLVQRLARIRVEAAASLALLARADALRVRAESHVDEMTAELDELRAMCPPRAQCVCRKRWWHRWMPGVLMRRTPRC